MTSFWESVRERLDDDGRVFVALVVEHSVHSPGTTGARMAVFADGSTMGTIGGGAMELEIVRAARADFVGAGQPPGLRKLYHRKGGDGEKSGLICGGFQTNLYVTLRREEHLDVVNAIVEAAVNDHAEVLEISPEGLRIVPRAAAGVSVQHELREIEGRWLYRESARNLSRVAIMGGGHCGLALSYLMHRLGYHVSIYDTRPRVPTMLENDFADEKHIVDDFAEAAALIRWPRETSVVVMTTELASDVRALLGAAALPFPFVGVMGSRAKIAAIRKALAEAGIGRAFFDNFVAPVGLPIGSNTPDEIAISVAGQLLQRRAEAEKTARNLISIR